jgi:hypothetical protein
MGIKPYHADATSTGCETPRDAGGVRAVASQQERDLPPTSRRRHRVPNAGSQDTEVGHPIATPSLAGQFNRVDPGD